MKKSKLKIRAEHSYYSSGDTGYDSKTSYIKGVLTGYRLRQRDERKKEVINIRDITDEQARQEIEKLFTIKRKALYFSDIAEKLKLDMEQVVRICMSEEKAK